MDLKKEIAALEQKLAAGCPDGERRRLSAKLAEKTTFFNILMEKNRRR